MSPFLFSLSCSEVSPKLPALTLHMQLAILTILLIKFCLTKLPLPLCCGPFPPRTGQGVWALAQVYFQDKLPPTQSIVIWGFFASGFSILPPPLALNPHVRPFSAFTDYSEPLDETWP